MLLLESKGSHINSVIKFYEQVNKLWKVQMDELISTYGDKKLLEKKPQWDNLNVIQHMVSQILVLQKFDSVLQKKIF